MQPTNDWGPALEVHRIEARRSVPVHTDSQIPLTSQFSTRNLHIFQMNNCILITFLKLKIIDEMEFELDTMLETGKETDTSDSGIHINCGTRRY